MTKTSGTTEEWDDGGWEDPFANNPLGIRRTSGCAAVSRPRFRSFPYVGECLPLVGVTACRIVARPAIAFATPTVGPR